MRWVLCALTCVALLAASAGSAQQAQRRVALVMGNGAYSQAAWRLTNPTRDATIVADRVRALGFDVELVVDADRAAMEGAFARFGQRLKAGGRDAVGFFYYAGHGAQRDGVNYLVPIDSSARTADQLRFQSPPMQFLLDDMAEAGNAVNLIVLDACRDMPLEEGFRTAGGGGLADVGRLPNVFIAYAAAPGRTASDGGGTNSPFTATFAEALLRQARDPIELMFSDVNARVYAATSGAQSPEYRNGLVRAPRWSFSSGTAPPIVTQPAPSTQKSTRPTPRLATGQIMPLDCPECPQLVYVPGGTFKMGSLSTESGRSDDEGPQRTVTIAPFLAGRYEVTFDEWDACVAAGGCNGYRPVDNGWGRGRRPVMHVSFEHAKSYVSWVRRETGKSYRLLSEAEWEFLARGGTVGPYWWGPTISFRQANFHDLEADRGSGGWRQRTLVVGAFQPNPFGAFDVHGNVSEWVEDCYLDSYASAPTDGSPVRNGMCDRRVNRGGSFDDTSSYLRAASRGNDYPRTESNETGLRVAQSMD